MQSDDAPLPTPACANCRYSAQIESITGLPESLTLTCRRHAPPSWMPVSPEWWCGDYEFDRAA